ncbi:hypothetical protein GCM10020221_10670 [Streptomyces thioluteus]|uniref:Uncharacterized protein n=1 Tax=Streptomyces thioluteus TaxID=66431 RepID=A0ABN3WIY8_STRTU
MQAAGGRAEVVGVVDADPHLDQASGRGADEAQLAAAVAGGEPAVAVGAQAELGVVGGRRGGVGDADGDGGQPVCGHDGIPLLTAGVHGRTGAWRAVRRAWAMMVRVGLTAADDGKKPPSTT